MEFVLTYWNGGGKVNTCPQFMHKEECEDATILMAERQEPPPPSNNYQRPKQQKNFKTMNESKKKKTTSVSKSSKCPIFLSVTTDLIVWTNALKNI